MTESSMGADVLDLLVIGGGVMGLFTAYHASQQFDRVTVLERGYIGDPLTASFGRTRSYRRDYLDAGYARFADTAITLWTDFEASTSIRALVRCGCMNIVKDSITPDTGATYAQLSYDVMDRIGMRAQTLDAAELADRFPYLQADLGYLDDQAGLVDLQAVAGALVAGLRDRDAQILEHTELTAVSTDGDLIRLSTSAGELVTRSLVITAGHGSNEVLASLPGCDLQIPITKDRPSEAKYFMPAPEIREQFLSQNMPVIAYLDTGIYLHPIVEGVIDAVKIGYYNPPDLPRGSTSIDSIASFVEQCLPGLKDTETVDVLDVDQCNYDLVADDDFVLGAVPGFTNVFLGVGWRGTGYKFAPWVGRVLFELALQDGTVYDIGRFDPARFSSSTAEGNPS